MVAGIVSCVIVFDDSFPAVEGVHWLFRGQYWVGVVTMPLVFLLTRTFKVIKVAKIFAPFSLSSALAFSCDPNGTPQTRYSGFGWRRLDP